MKNIQRTDNLEKGVRTLSNGTVVRYETESGGMRKLRCNGCSSGIAIPTKTVQGKDVYKCTSCGAEFTSTRM